MDIPSPEEHTADITTAVSAANHDEHAEESNTIHHLRQQLDHLAGNYDSTKTQLEELTIHTEVLKKEFLVAQEENTILRERLQVAERELEEERQARESENASNTGLIATLRQQVHDSRRAIMSLQEEAAQSNRRRQQAIESESSKRASIFGPSGIGGGSSVHERKTSLASKRSSIFGSVFQQSGTSGTSTSSSGLPEGATSPSLSAVDDSSSFHRGRAHLALEGARNVSPLLGGRSPEQELPQPNFRRRTSTVSHGVGLGLPSDMLPTATRQSSSNSILSLGSGVSASDNRDGNENNQVVAELQSLKNELSRTKTQLREAQNAKEASDTCLQALREIISQGRLDGDTSSLTQLSLPKLPTDTDVDDEVEAVKQSCTQINTTDAKSSAQGRWSMLWGKKKSPNPTEANVPVSANVSIPLNEDISEDSESSTPAAKSFGFSFSSLVPTLKNEEWISSSSTVNDRENDNARTVKDLPLLPNEMNEHENSMLHSKDRAVTPSLTDGASPPTSSFSSPKQYPADQRQSVNFSESLSLDAEHVGAVVDGKDQSVAVNGISQAEFDK